MTDELLPPLRGILSDAVQRNATDIHLDSLTDSAVMRLRIEGEIRHREVMSAKKAQKTLNQIKAVTGMEPGVSVFPREGQFHCRIEDREIDVRAAVVLAADRKEAAHLRILTPPAWHGDLVRLGLDDGQTERIRQSIGGLQGLVLIAGPSGSGKTTTAYSVLEMLESDLLIAASIEAPPRVRLAQRSPVGGQ